MDEWQVLELVFVLMVVIEVHILPPVSVGTAYDVVRLPAALTSDIIFSFLALMTAENWPKSFMISSAAPSNPPLRKMNLVLGRNIILLMRCTYHVEDSCPTVG